MMSNQAPSNHLPIITCHNLLKRRDFKEVRSFVEMNRLVGNEWNELDQAEAISDVIIAAENRLPNGLTDYYGMIRATRLGPVVLDDFLRLMRLLDGRSNHFPCSNEAACYAMEAWTFLSKPAMKTKYDMAISTADMISGQNRQTHVVNNRWGGIGVQGGGTNRGNNSGSIGFGGNERFNRNGEFFSGGRGIAGFGRGGSGKKNIGGGERGVDDRFGAIGLMFGGGRGVAGGSSRQGIGGGEDGVNGKISNGNGGFGCTSGFFGGVGDRSGKGISGVYHKTSSDDYGLDAIFGGGISVAGGRGRKDISGGEGGVDGGISSGNNISSGRFDNIDGSFGGGIDIAGGSGSKGIGGGESGVSSGTHGGNGDCDVRFDNNNEFGCEGGSGGDIGYYFNEKGTEDGGGFGGVDKEKQKVETVWSICSNCYIMHGNEICMRCNKVPIEFESTTNMIPSGFPVESEKGEDQFSHLAGMLQLGLPENSSFIPKEQNLGQSWLPENSSFIPKEQNLGRGIEDVVVQDKASVLGETVRYFNELKKMVKEIPTTPALEDSL
ncbi:unnamed protein product [Arabis nemorensis]|uniref:Uncharacterized protein n=1 Tax=Arabis nemorensis TaxID=586526 RepID=A0A565C8C5_9BRAS|nr:unnamed protein product [Arabis nemorensis]